MSRDHLLAAWPPDAAVAAAAGHRPISPMQAIRRKCLDCSAGQIAEVRQCVVLACPLWPFRAGRHPYTKTRLLEADFEEGHPEGTPVPENPSSSGIGLQEADCRESGPSGTAACQHAPEEA